MPIDFLNSSKTNYHYEDHLIIPAESVSSSHAKDKDQENTSEGLAVNIETCEYYILSVFFLQRVLALVM